VKTQQHQRHFCVHFPLENVQQVLLTFCSFVRVVRVAKNTKKKDAKMYFENTRQTNYASTIILKKVCTSYNIEYEQYLSLYYYCVT
jgi:hypothetical protein